jgi:hypothetical protein
MPAAPLMLWPPPQASGLRRDPHSRGLWSAPVPFLYGLRSAAGSVLVSGAVAAPAPAEVAVRVLAGGVGRPECVPTEGGIRTGVPRPPGTRPSAPCANVATLTPDTVSRPGRTNSPAILGTKADQLHSTSETMVQNGPSIRSTVAARSKAELAPIGCAPTVDSDNLAPALAHEQV